MADILSPQLSCEHDQLQQDCLAWRKESVNNMDDIQATLSPLAEQVLNYLCIDCI